MTLLDNGASGRPSPAPLRRRSKGFLRVAVTAAFVIAALAGAWLSFRPPAMVPTPPPHEASAPATPVIASPSQSSAAPEMPSRLVVRVATEAEILANRSADLDIFQFASNPRILVLDFAELRDQGSMLNRVAALIEKAQTPRDRVLSDAELDAAIRAAGETKETYYLGHDYSAAELARFFTLAAGQGVQLSDQEKTLRRLLEQQGYLGPGAVGAVISVPREDASSTVDAATRATILRHELSHGEFFTNPEYADYSRGFWYSVMPEPVRAKFRQFLAGQGYDPKLADLTVNESQAYLMHTADPRFFNAAAIKLAPETLSVLRDKFYAGMPTGWLRDTTPKPTVPRPIAPSPAKAPRHRSVVRRRASAARRAPCSRAVSTAS